MATQTPNYNLTKPATTDFYDIGDFNGNSDIIDAALKKHDDHIGGLGNAIGMRGWNQLVKNGDFKHYDNWAAYDTSKISLSVSQGIAMVTAIEAGAGYSFGIYSLMTKSIIGHKYLVSFDVNTPVSRVYGFDDYGGIARSTVTDLNTWVNVGTIWSCTSEVARIIIQPSGVNMAIGESYKVKNVMSIDLTALFGAGNEPSTAEEFRAMFPADYYPYCRGQFADLLWTNASPSSSFAGQTVSLDLSDYKFVAIRFFEAGSAYGGMDIASKGTRSVFSRASVSGELVTMRTYGRYFNATDAGVVFYEAYRTDSTGSAIQDNSMAVPYQIYGVR